MKKVLSVFALVIAFTTWTPTRAQSGITGTWRAESTPPGQALTLVLRASGLELTGAARNCGAPPLVISEGNIDGNTITFKCHYADAGHTVALTGVLNGDEIELSWELQIRDGGIPLAAGNQLFGPSAPPKFTAKRVPASVDTALENIANNIGKTSPVSFDRILHADLEPQNWLTYSGSVRGQRYSPLTQITPANVKNLELAWIWQAQSLPTFEATPLVVDAVLYTVQAPNDVVALDAATGHVLWMLPYTPAADARPCCGRVNRGLAILGNTLYMGTLDAHLLAIDAQTGKLLWNVEVAKSSERYTITHAPLVVKDKILLGTAGGDFPIRGFIAAFDATTGKEVWRLYTIPGVGEPGNETWSGDSWKTGGAGIWNSGAYDPDLNLTYWGVGNPSPSDGAKRLGDNLYSDSVVALDADTGKLKWHYQFTPHDNLDWDAAQVPVLADIQWQGRPRKVILQATKNGLMYVLDRTTGEFLMGKPFVEVNWMGGFDEKGRPRLPEKVGAEKTPIMPRTAATNWYPPSYSPSTGLFYIPSWESLEGSLAAGLTANRAGDTYAALRAFDPATGEKKWEFRVSQTKTLFGSGALSTASGLVFTGASNKYFYALDARTGELLWKRSLAGSVSSGPISYSVGGRQYIAVAAGNTLFALALGE